MNNKSWDTKDYTKNFSFVHQYGEDLLNMLKSKAGAKVLDLGCGNGALTAQLAEKYDVYGMDASPEFIETAKSMHPELTFVIGDAVDFTVEEPLDAIFSNAVFHWIEKEKHPSVLNCAYKALKAGGEMVFEMGGYTNNDLIHGALAEESAKMGIEYKIPFYFPQIGEYSEMLENAGFMVREAYLFDRKTLLQGEDGLYNWMRMFTKNPFIGVDPEVTETIWRKAADSLKPILCEDGVWYADYVRLRIRAEKPNR